MKKLLAIFVAAILLVCFAVGCGKNVVDKNNNVVNGEFSDYLIAEKIGTLDIENFQTADGGVFYKSENGNYGILSYNGVYDTGAIYATMEQKGKYFQVNTTAPSSDNDITTLNSSKLIDNRGRTVIPSGFMAFQELNERYFQVATATNITLSEDSAIASRSKSGLCFLSPYSDSTLYKGKWYVYDIVKNRLVPGISGEDNQTLLTYGRFIKYQKDKDYIVIDENGDVVTDVEKFFEDGSYSVESKIGEVFDADGELLFKYDLAGLIPSYYEHGYYIATKYGNNGTKYAVMDNTGKIVSPEFDDMMTIYGEIFECNEKIYNIEGKNIIKGTYKTVRRDEMFGQYYMLINDDYYTLIDKKGNVYFNGPYDDDHMVASDDILACEQREDGNYYYSYKDRDYTINGYSFAPWIVKTPSNNNLYDLVDAMTGKKLLEGYDEYSHISRRANAYYVYAKYNGGADIYLIESSSQMEEITKKKADLFADLSAAFEKEGIQATINRDSGEIILNSSVLFGGDSAELTAEGKAFLNKFIKVYTDIAFSDKYAGFISKTMIEGHVAPVSGDSYADGLPLSQERAINVKNYCLSAETGINLSSITSKFEDVGYSNSKPVYDSNGNVDMAASRRVSFRFMVNVEE